MSVTLKPNEERTLAEFAVQSKASLIPPKLITTSIIIDRDNEGNVVGAELKSGQKGQTYFDKDGTVRDDKGNLVQFHAAK